jgi:hypothetical protein
MPRAVFGRLEKALKKKFKYFWLHLTLPVFFFSAVNAQSLGDKLRADIEDGRLDDFSKIEAAFILSGADQPDSLDAGIRWYQGLVQTLENFRFQMTDRAGSARKVFACIHGLWLKKYETGATTMLDVKNRGTYNCVSGTVLFNLLCESLGWSTEAFETPTHVYSIFDNFGEKITVENTSPMGFDITKNLREYSTTLFQFYPQNRALQIGLDRIYAYENSRGRPIDNTELLGLLAYNRAYFFRKDDDFERAFDFVLFAQKFNGDSRSNVDFEIDLYYRWGKTLYDQGRMDKAFEVCAGGFKRHPEVKDFRNNARAIFFKLLQSEKDWNATRPFFDVILELQIPQTEDAPMLERYLEARESLCVGRGEKEKAEEIRSYRERISSDLKSRK